ncbi:F-box protein At1g67340-like [Phalaenopsis equestris]|uniref:F-box protein At1g67340-like n=1 Tax=Phalaenopsis equestris TaxID=78828 RepID=UPI0009E5BA18|nr:F-box protein At1g67340-like [Phalaenopsis equestris]
MQTRSGLCYPRPPPAAKSLKTKRCYDGGDGVEPRKRACTADQRNDYFNGLPARRHSSYSDKQDGEKIRKMDKRSELRHTRPPPVVMSPKRGYEGDGGEPRKRARSAEQRIDFFNGLPDDLVLLIFSKLSASAACPSDLISVFLTCRRFNQLAMQRMVLSKLSVKGTAVRAKNWTESTHKFLQRCAEAGNFEASYTLGMICFYCLQNRGLGASLLTKAAMASHPEALHSLSIIQFNGSGGSKEDKDLRAGVALCARAAYHGHIDAIRELGHCLQDGYGVRQNVAEGRRFLLQANTRELAAVRKGRVPVSFSRCSLLSDFGCNVPTPEAHPANRFMVEWFAARGGPAAADEGKEGLRMCSHSGCGRPETRRHEFRRCSVCGAVNYCSRACQAMHWKTTHKGECAPMERWLEGQGAVEVGQADLVVAGDAPAAADVPMEVNL